MKAACYVAVVAATLLAGCGARSELVGAGGPLGVDGPGGADCVGVGVESVSLTGRIHDFSMSHPDFEKFLGEDPGIVVATLGDDGTPVYGDHASTLTTTGKASFDQWFHDVPGVNLGTDFSLPLVGDLGSVSFVDGAFFPVDGDLLGNEGMNHNFSFTVAMAGQFRYRGGEVFSVGGDDDLWIFVDRHLAVDLGGVHSSEDGSVSVDALAGELGLVPGEVYPLHVFFAERHTEKSTLRVTLSGPALCLLAP